MQHSILRKNDTLRDLTLLVHIILFLWGNIKPEIHVVNLSRARKFLHNVNNRALTAPYRMVYIA